MKFDLVRPCGECPFRTDRPPFIRAGKVREVLGDPNGRGAKAWPSVSFACHKTVGAKGRVRPDSQHCAGVAIVLLRDGQPNQAMQLAERLLGVDWGRLDMTSPVYASREAAIAAQEACCG